MVSFGYLDLYLAPATADHGLVLCEISSGKRAFGIVGVSIDNSGKLIPIHLIGGPRDQDVEYADPTYEKKERDALIQQNQLTQFFPKIEKILLAEYLQNPNAPWRLCSDKSVRGQHTDPNEKDHLAATKDFTREKAADLWKSIRKAQDITPVPPVNTSPAPVASTPIISTLQIQPAGESGLPLWLYAIILLSAAFLIGFWYFLRNKK